MRQSFRNLNDSDEENVATQQPPRIKVNTAPKMGPPPQVEMERLLKFREQKRKLKQTQEQQPLLPAKRKPFVATISRQDISLTYKRIFEPYKKCTKKEATTTLAGPTNRAPLRPVAPFLNGRDHQAPPERIPLPKSACKKTIQSDAKQQHPLGEWKGRTPLLAFRNVPPRVDCWWPKSGPPLITLDGGCLQRPAASVSAKKPNPSVSAKKPATVRALESKSSRKPSAKQGNATNSSKKPPQGQPQRKQPAVMVFHGTKAGSKAANGTSNAKAVLTSTVRKTKNAFTFTLAPNENAGRPQFQSLACGKMDELFDGISPIETHSPAPPTAADSPKQRPRTKVPDAKHRKEESFWEPQPVAFLSLAAETTGVAVDNVERPVTTSLDESSSSVVCLGEIETVGQSKNRSPTDEQSTMMLAGGGGTPKRAVSLNESFTVSEDVGGTDDEVFCAKTSAKEPAFGCRPTIEAIDETVATEEPQPAQTQKRCSLVFTEQINVPPAEPSMPGEHSSDAMPSPLCSRRLSSTKRRSSVYTVSEQGTQMPEEVRSKTDFYKDKVQCELARLQMLCDEYGPYLESDTLNEHCRGLLMAAQGQTNILINKKLTKFQELIGHYESNWTDRKVRKDDLDGFWQMVALDMENLDQRFEELRSLRANDWQPIVQEEATADDLPAKTKKLQAGAGIRKRERKGAANGAAGKSSSVVAELIRQARLEQKKKKLTDLGELAETVTLVTTPLKRSQRLAETPKRNSVARRSSICMVCTPTAADARKQDRSANKCGSIFPEADNEDEDNLKPSLRSSASNGSRSAKSVLFMDACLETPQSRRRQSTRKIVDTPKPAKDRQDEHDPESSSPAAPKQTSQQRNRRKSIVSFTEQIDDPPTVPSKSNLRLEEADLLGLLNNSSLAKSLRKAAKTKELQMPEEVRSKTDFYKDKVQCELARLQTLCDEYGPYLESDTLNEHCRGLLMAAQGQTNILINKKLTKFQELIDHYESNWTDRKVRKDDLDGFWQMVALDLENLNQRFEELRTLRANDWQPIVQEEATGDDQPAKTKKLQAGAGIRKRERKGAANGAAGKSSSVVAELIRKARLEQKKKKVTDLGELTETVTLVTSPVKRSQRVAESGSELKQRASVCFGFAPAIASPATKDTRRTMFPGLNRRSRDNLKSILKTPNVDRANESKSVLFLDNALQTPLAGDTTTTRTRQFPVTPKLRLKFNDQLELEHIDRLDSRTPSRLEDELRKRLRQSLLSNSASTGESAEVEKTESTSTDRCTGTPRTNAASKRKSRRISRTLAAIFDDANDGVVEESPVPMMGRMRTRASANTPRRNAS
ncbi:uncharacterized protein LOC126577673 [Anopheles aquasalis]|uniref:uncharacterized protein LOC126577673 n=1 Tax=Anopheles aquasalis TaxID=42839 RepID=UPI00215AE2F0|nr:uncharacterized protein LOC126577673 [Anopheles aquasalis]